MLLNDYLFILHGMNTMIFRISKNQVSITPFVDNKLYNERGDSAPHTYVDFTYMGGIKGAFKYIFVGPARAMKYIVKRIFGENDS